MKNMITALGNMGLFLPEDSYNVARTGDTVVIGKSRGYIDLGNNGKIH
ncbi:MAG TPA: hypothetical protein VMR16_01885 [Candidatus Saccharimonadales bacterium]|nr:hypothetical protein [Candidatus Saccharimonadales bacterium]